MNIEKRIEFFSDLAVIVPSADEEAMRVDLVDPEGKVVYATGEETGEQYQLELEGLDMNDYIFYKLVRATLDESI